MNVQGLRMKSMLNTVCRSYLKHPAREEMLAAHSAERWARWSKAYQSYGPHLTAAKQMAA